MKPDDLSIKPRLNLVKTSFYPHWDSVAVVRCRGVTDKKHCKGTEKNGDLQILVSVFMTFVRFCKD